MLWVYEVSRQFWKRLALIIVVKVGHVKGKVINERLVSHHKE